MENGSPRRLPFPLYTVSGPVILRLSHQQDYPETAQESRTRTW